MKIKTVWYKDKEFDHWNIKEIQETDSCICETMTKFQMACRDRSNCSINGDRKQFSIWKKKINFGICMLSTKINSR